MIDDRADVVWQARRKGIKVDGVHIGQTDMEPREARALLGDEAIVGLSAETESLVRLINELPDGCIDYIGAGPLQPHRSICFQSAPKTGKADRQPSWTAADGLEQRRLIGRSNEINPAR